MLFAGTPYGHPALGHRRRHRGDHARRREGLRRAAPTPAATLTVGVSGDVPDGLRGRLQRRPRRAARRGRAGARRRESWRGGRAGIEVEIVAEGDARHRDLLRPSRSRSPASHPDFAALSRGAGLARRAPLVESPPVRAHPRDARDELRRLRLHRGLPARHVPVLPRARTSRGGRSSSRSGSAPWRRRTRTWRCASRCTSWRSWSRDGLTRGRLRGHARTT